MITLLHIIIILLSFVFGLIFRNYFPKYFGEKAKNLATKEDIGEITKIVEIIKTNLLKETEILKGNISIINQNSFNVSSLYREALIDYNKKYSSWLNSILVFYPQEYDENNIEELDKYISELNKRKYKFKLAENHIFLFHNENEHINLNFELYKSTLDIEKHFKKVIIELKALIKIYSVEILTVNDSNSKINRYKRFQEDITKLTSDYMEKLNKYHKSTSYEYAKSSNYIKSLISNTLITKPNLEKEN